MASRAGLSASQRMEKSITIMYNLCNEPCCMKAQPCCMEQADSTSSQAGDSEESQNSNAEKGEIVDVYRFSRCKINLPQSTMLEKGIPLPVDVLEVIDDDLDWGNVLWSDTGVWVGDKEYKIVRMLYLAPTGVASIL